MKTEINRPLLQDGLGRKISYLRLSVTDRCDFRCTYCMAEKMDFLPRADILSLEECLLVARTFVGLGVNKIRLTGGEPLVRKDFPWLAEHIRELDGLRELAITTNGSQLVRYAAPLAQAGVDRINISLDSLNPEIFKRITRSGDLHQVLAGVDAAIAAFGGHRIKLNSVMLRNINHQELPTLVEFALTQRINISFIEQMPLGLSGHDYSGSYYSSNEALAQLRQHYELVASVESSGGPARYWRIPGHETRIGFISPHSHNFCASCNRMRVTARGELFPCLGDEGMVDLLPAVRAGDESGLRDLICSLSSTSLWAMNSIYRSASRELFASCHVPGGNSISIIDSNNSLPFKGRVRVGMGVNACGGISSHPTAPSLRSPP